MAWAAWWKRISYTVWSPVYNLVARVMAKRRARSIERLALAAGERVLIVGAGTGLDLDLLPRGLDITAIDLTPAMLQRLVRRAKRLGLQVDARVMNAESLAFPDGSFDVVILHFIVAVVPDPVACAREAARVLRPGGRGVILDKFLPDGRRPPLAMRLVNPLASCLATHITRQLGPILTGSGFIVESNEPAGVGGFLRIVLVRKK